MVCLALRTGDCTKASNKLSPRSSSRLPKPVNAIPDILCEEVLKDIRRPQQWAASEAARSSVLGEIRQKARDRPDRGRYRAARCEVRSATDAALSAICVMVSRAESPASCSTADARSAIDAVLSAICVPVCLTASPVCALQSCTLSFAASANGLGSSSWRPLTAFSNAI
jgi:hypothetical protein